MSLDVYLEMPGEGGNLMPATVGSGIFIRRDGSMVEISREEWDQLYPGCEPVVVKPEYANSRVYEANITHNLNRMADAAGIYTHLWRPDEIGAKSAKDLIGPLRDGLAKLQSEPEKFRQFNPANGWGDYEGMCRFVANYLAACMAYPEARVRVWR